MNYGHGTAVAGGVRAIPSEEYEKMNAVTDARAHLGMQKGLADARPATCFDIVTETLSFANQLANRLVMLSDSLLGPLPPPSAKDDVAPDGALPRLAASADYTHSRLGEAMAALDRIERALP